MAASPRVAADAVRTVLGPVGGSLISLAIVISTFGVIGIYTLTAPRIYYAMAADGVFFRRVAGIHPRFGTPAFSIMLQSVWAAVLVLFWGTFENLISYVVFTDWIFFALAGASVIVLRRKMPDAARPYRVPGYPWVPLFFVGTSAWFVAMTLISKPAQAWAGLGFLGLGVPAYYYWKRTSTEERHER
jgi:APA family basic amino acid/polyamine antiporter